MKDQNFTTSILVDQTAKEVFEAIKNVRGWWSGLYEESFEGDSDKIGDEFAFHAGGGAHYTKQKLTELIPDRKIVWLVTDSRLSFVESQSEWTGTELCFDITPEGDKTRIIFTHKGLVPQFECYDACAPAWTQYVQEQLVSWLNTGKAQSN